MTGPLRTALLAALLVGQGGTAPAQTGALPEEPQLRALLTCVGDAVAKGAAEVDLRNRIAFLCALARAPVTASCGHNEYLFDVSREMCARRDRRFWTAALARAYGRAGLGAEGQQRVAALVAGCDGETRRPADPVGCVTNALWREWSKVATGTFLDILAAQQADERDQTEITTQ